MNNEPPRFLDGARVICYTPLDTRHRTSGRTKHFRDGQLQTGFSGLVIAEYDEHDGYYLFYCDAEWNVENDTFHASIKEAKDQAEFEFLGTSETWIERL